MYSQTCARCDFWEERETGEEFCTSEFCIHFPEELQELIKEQEVVEEEQE